MTNTRKCPTCNKELSYKSEWLRDKAEEKGSQCRSCSKKGTRPEWHKEAMRKGNVGRKRKPQSEETKAKISKARMGKYHFKHTEETRAKMSASHHKRHGTEPGKKQRAWYWSYEVKERDNNECQYCGSKEELHAHHIFSFSKHPYWANNVSNGITLCAPCHYEHHKLNFLV